jgi:hypothetical protein
MLRHGRLGKILLGRDRDSRVERRKHDFGRLPGLVVGSKLG